MVTNKGYWYFYYLFLFLVFVSPISLNLFGVNVNEHKINSIYIVLIQAFIPFPIAFIYLSFINKNLKSDVDWTLGKELLNLSILLLLIGIAGFFNTGYTIYKSR